MTNTCQNIIEQQHNIAYNLNKHKYLNFKFVKRNSIRNKINSMQLNSSGRPHCGLGVTGIIEMLNYIKKNDQEIIDQLPQE